MPCCDRSPCSVSRTTPRRAYQEHPKHVAFANAFVPRIENAARAHYGAAG